MTMLQQVADVLSIITIATCFILKLPQILKLIAVKSANGISIAGLLLELVSYTVMTSYNYTNGYSVLSYFEYPVILIQEYILIFLVLRYLNSITEAKTVIIAGLYFATSFCLVTQIIPKGLLTILAPMCTPISASSKILQLVAIVRARNADSVSPATWFISAFTNLTRVFTIWMDSADLLLLGNFIISVILSSSVMVTAIYFRSVGTKKD